MHLADPAANAQEIAAWVRRASERGAAAAVFPELAVTGYSCEDLFHSEALLAGAREALRALAKQTADLPTAAVVGAPYRTPDGRLYNCAFVLSRGRVRGA